MNYEPFKLLFQSTLDNKLFKNWLLFTYMTQSEAERENGIFQWLISQPQYQNKDGRRLIWHEFRTRLTWNLLKIEEEDKKAT